jgi:hypothetical protein
MIKVLSVFIVNTIFITYEVQLCTDQRGYWSVKEQIAAIEYFLINFVFVKCNQALILYQRTP